MKETPAIFAQYYMASSNSIFCFTAVIEGPQAQEVTVCLTATFNGCNPVMSVLLAAGITWGKVVAMYAVAGALAVDCVRQGHPSTIHIIVDSLGQFVRKFLAPWLKRRGGWVRDCSQMYS